MVVSLRLIPTLCSWALPSFYVSMFCHFPSSYLLLVVRPSQSTLPHLPVLPDPVQSLFPTTHPERAGCAEISPTNAAAPTITSLVALPLPPSPDLPPWSGSSGSSLSSCSSLSSSCLALHVRADACTSLPFHIVAASSPACTPGSQTSSRRTPPHPRQRARPAPPSPRATPVPAWCSA